MERKTDRRSRRTQRAIREAFLQLLSQKPIERITVKEITDLADIHRATFYSHYEDIPDLYREVESGFFGRLTAIMEDEAITTYQVFYDALLNYVQENLTIAKAIFCNSSPAAGSAFTEQLENYFAFECENTWREEAGIDQITPELEYFIYYRIHGIMAMVRHWLASGCKMSPDQLKTLISDLDETTDTFMISRTSRH